MKKLVAALALILCSVLPALAQSTLSDVAGVRVARNYNFTPQRIFAGPVAAASPATFQMTSGSVALTDGRTIVPFFIGQSVKIGEGSTAETVTLTAVSGCTRGAAQGACTISGNTSNAHGQGDVVASATAGLGEAMWDAFVRGGGEVVVDSDWSAVGGTSAMISAALPLYNVGVLDNRGAAVQNWKLVGGATTLAAPAVLTAATAVPSTTPAGSYGTGTYYMCVAYVDIMGQEGPCSATFSQAGLTSGSFVFSAPAASPGAVGYTIYISLTSGSYVLAYKVPLTSSICTLTTLETTTAACAVANATYGQAGASAAVTAITVNTSPIDPQVTTISTTSVYVPNAGGRTTYAYSPGSPLSTPGLVSSTLPFTIAAAAGTTVPAVIGTVNIPPGFMNYVGRVLEVCGYATSTATAATIENIQFQWDAFGQNTAGKGVLIGNLTTTTTFGTTGHIGFCEDFETTVAGATATSGSILDVGGFIGVAGVDLAATVAGGGNTLAATVGSLNLASEARINVIYLHTTATDGAGFILQGLTAKVIN